MKQIITILLLFSLTNLNAQNEIEYQFSDSTYQIEKLIIKEFGKQKLNNFQGMLELMGRGPFKFGINSLELKRTLLNNESSPAYDTSSMIGMCHCSTDSDGLRITLNRSAFPGTAVEIKVSIKDKNTSSKLSYFTDDMETHRLDKEGDFVANIDVPLKTVELIISKDSELKHEGKLSGKYQSKSSFFFEKENNITNKISYEITSHFECQLINMDIIMSKTEK